MRFRLLAFAKDPGKKIQIYYPTWWFDGDESHGTIRKKSVVSGVWPLKTQLVFVENHLKQRELRKKISGCGIFRLNKSKIFWCQKKNTRILVQPVPPSIGRPWVTTQCGCQPKNRGGTPKSSILIGFSMVFHYKPSILGYPNFWKHPCSLITQQKYVPWSKVAFFGDKVIPPLMGILVMGPYKPLVLGWWPSPIIRK